MSAISLRRPFAAGERLPRVAAFIRTRPELIGLVVLAALLNLWGLDSNGFANDYYAAAVRSMSSSWHAFLYGSFDAAGVMTVDKPPLASWVQVAFVKVFGYGSWSLLVPQALMGVGSVCLVYALTRRLLGRVAGAVAGLVLALTPMTVAISRHNNPDALLVLCSVAALYFLVRALEDGRGGRWLALAGVAVGLGFEAKMAVALMVVPGIVAAWLWVAPRGLRSALRGLVGFAGAAVVVGGAWPLLMALTPASDRPWVSGTSDNSIVSLIFGYNGLGRLGGQAGGPQGMAGGPGGGGGGGPFGGPAGPFRLLESSLGGQAGWLLGLAVVGGVAVVATTRLRRADARSGWIIAVGGTFLTCAVAFSSAKGIFHPYYVSLLAPFAAALVGAGAGRLWRADGLNQVLAFAGIAAGVFVEIAVLRDQPGQLTWLKPLLLVGGFAAIALLVLELGPRVRTAVLAAVLGLLLLAPASWSVQTLGHATNGTFPAGGPASGGPMNGGMFGGDSQGLTQAVRYAKAHGGGTVVTGSQSGASAPIIGSGADTAAIGGFSGRESQVSTSWLAGAVKSGQIRWVLVDQQQGSGFGGPGARDGRVGSSQVMEEVAKTCKAVPSVDGLYDCSGYGAALAAGGT